MTRRYNASTTNDFYATILISFTSCLHGTRARPTGLALCERAFSRLRAGTLSFQIRIALDIDQRKNTQKQSTVDHIATQKVQERVGFRAFISLVRCRNTMEEARQSQNGFVRSAIYVCRRWSPTISYIYGRPFVRLYRCLCMPICLYAHLPSSLVSHLSLAAYLPLRLSSRHRLDNRLHPLRRQRTHYHSH